MDAAAAESLFSLREIAKLSACNAANFTGSPRDFITLKKVWILDTAGFNLCRSSIMPAVSKATAVAIMPTGFASIATVSVLNALATFINIGVAIASPDANAPTPDDIAPITIRVGAIAAAIPPIIIIVFFVPLSKSLNFLSTAFAFFTKLVKAGRITAPKRAPNSFIDSWNIRIWFAAPSEVLAKSP